MRIAFGFGLALAFGAASAAAAQQHAVSGYYRSNGTYVAPHMSADPGYGASTPTPSYGYQPDHTVSGYTASSGTYVAPYHATNPNGFMQDNYSTKGNVNPYTGQPGTKACKDIYGNPC